MLALSKGLFLGSNVFGKIYRHFSEHTGWRCRADPKIQQGGPRVGHDLDRNPLEIIHCVSALGVTDTSLAMFATFTPLAI